MERLLPQAWFEALPDWALLPIAAFALFVLIKGADVLVEAVAAIAYKFNVSKIVVAATILSIGTTSPETAVGVQAALAGTPGLALGNAIGSVVCNAALIFGVGCLVGRISVDRFVIRRQGAWHVAAMLLIAGASYLFFYEFGPAAVLPRWFGGVLILGVALYIVMNVRWSRLHPRAEPFVQPEGAPQIAEPQPTKTTTVLAILSVLCLMIVLISSRAFVASATVLADRWGIPPVVVAATIVSVGTSLPELVISVTSVRKGHGEMLVGNVIGANVMNLLLVIGASCLARPLQLVNPEIDRPNIFLTLHIPFMLITVLIFSQLIAATGRRMQSHRGYGIVMLAVFVAYVAVQFLFM